MDRSTKYVSRFLNYLYACYFLCPMNLTLFHLSLQLPWTDANKCIDEKTKSSI